MSNLISKQRSRGLKLTKEDYLDPDRPIDWEAVNLFMNGFRYSAILKKMGPISRDGTNMYEKMRDKAIFTVMRCTQLYLLEDGTRPPLGTKLTQDERFLAYAHRCVLLELRGLLAHFVNTMTTKGTKAFVMDALGASQMGNNTEVDNLDFTSKVATWDESPDSPRIVGGELWEVFKKTYQHSSPEMVHIVRLYFGLEGSGGPFSLAQIGKLKLQRKLTRAHVANIIHKAIRLLRQIHEKIYGEEVIVHDNCIRQFSPNTKSGGKLKNRKCRLPRTNKSPDASAAN